MSVKALTIQHAAPATPSINATDRRGQLKSIHQPPEAIMTDDHRVRQHTIAPRVLSVWRMTFGLFGGPVIVVLALVAALLAWSHDSVLVRGVIAAGSIVVMATLAVGLGPGLALIQRSWSYRWTDDVFELGHGVIWRQSVSIPISRLQHVDIHRGPLERRAGLATLELHTAGTRHASHRLPGLEHADAIQLRDELLKRIRHQTERSHESGRPHQSEWPSDDDT
ncbi:Bacterial membrane flanked domain protein [Crateriforma conspicua]|nr:Bacterial membrane flanked domain protein [Crateriforma conspicua]